MIQSEILVEIQDQVRKKRAKKVVFVSGNFNILHPGHLRLLKFASEHGDFLVVGVNADVLAKEAVVVSEALRLEGIAAIGFVDFSFILSSNISDFLTELKPHFVVKGNEFKNTFNEEQGILEKYGGQLIFSSGDTVFSSMDLIRQELNPKHSINIQHAEDFLNRHKTKFDTLKDVISSFSKLSVTVIGDLIVDEYVMCDPIGMSQEDPTIVVSPIRRDLFVGGAGIVAAHASGLGANVNYFGLCGKDDSAEFARKKLKEYNVSYQLLEDESRPTPLKQRFRALDKTLLRVNHLRHHEVDQRLMDQLLSQVEEVIEGSNLVIFSDFNYGMLSNSVLKRLNEFGKVKSKMMVADSQSSSQIGDISRFQYMNLITPTEREARLALRDFNSGLVVLAEKLRKKSKTSNVILTLGADGSLIHSPDSAKSRWVTDRLPALNTMPKDVAGAGDSLLVSASMALAMGANIWQASYIGSLAAACQVSRVGNIPLDSRTLLSEMDHFLNAKD